MVTYYIKGVTTSWTDSIEVQYYLFVLGMGGGAYLVISLIGKNKHLGTCHAKDKIK